jgi:hypothetical protein
MEEKAVDSLVVDTDTNACINNEQARQFAFNIVFDIIDYIKNNQAEYLKYLKEKGDL